MDVEVGPHYLEPGPGAGDGLSHLDQHLASSFSLYRNQGPKFGYECQ